MAKKYIQRKKAKLHHKTALKQGCLVKILEIEKNLHILQQLLLRTTRRHLFVGESTPRTALPADATVDFHCGPKFSRWPGEEDAVWRGSSTSRLYVLLRSLRPLQGEERRSDWHEIRSSSSNSATRDATEEPLASSHIHPAWKPPTANPPASISLSHLAVLHNRKRTGTHTHNAAQGALFFTSMGIFPLINTHFAGLGWIICELVANAVTWTLGFTASWAVCGFARKL